MKVKNKHVYGAKPDSEHKVVVARSYRKPRLPVFIQTLPRRTKIIIGGALLVFITVCIVLILQAILKEPARNVTVLPADTDRNYSTTSNESLPALIEYDFGMSVSEFKDADLSGKLNTFEQAHNAGIALYRLRKNDKALDAYAIAKDKMGDRVYAEFYAEYFGIAYRSGEVSLGDEIYNEAIKNISESDISADDKKYHLASLKFGRELLRKDATR